MNEWMTLEAGKNKKISHFLFYRTFHVPQTLPAEEEEEENQLYVHLRVLFCL